MLSRSAACSAGRILRALALLDQNGEDAGKQLVIETESEAGLRHFKRKPIRVSILASGGGNAFTHEASRAQGSGMKREARIYRLPVKQGPGFA